jgi:hypothetical protein
VALRRGRCHLCWVFSATECSGRVRQTQRAARARRRRAYTAGRRPMTRAPASCGGPPRAPRRGRPPRGGEGAPRRAARLCPEAEVQRARRERRVLLLGVYGDLAGWGCGGGLAGARVRIGFLCSGRSPSGFGRTGARGGAGGRGRGSEAAAGTRAPASGPVVGSGLGRANTARGKRCGAPPADGGRRTTQFSRNEVTRNTLMPHASAAPRPEGEAFAGAGRGREGEAGLHSDGMPGAAVAGRGALGRRRAPLRAAPPLRPGRAGPPKGGG